MSEPVKCHRCGMEGCPAAWAELNIRVGDPLLPITEAVIDIACSMRAMTKQRQAQGAQAAAADLLLALEGMVRCMGHHFDSEFVLPGDVEAYKAAKAAMKKARP